uniref:Uncharacterized protein n=1 Tax=Candidatus Kentrum sp. TC TaxID=2126339 RepID=A0A450YQI9_9GAMM|nr:MAG: hypothetical protein BECKTC1821E_GA0114239_102827 [Candidatus Kentron sp. TC]VFK58453.1 MAG: hypothetical protein BECKTC1821F_GA0114240_102424 [Candidatus Kentron sp. TC]
MYAMQLRMESAVGAYYQAKTVKIVGYGSVRLFHPSTIRTFMEAVHVVLSLHPTMKDMPGSGGESRLSSLSAWVGPKPDKLRFLVMNALGKAIPRAADRLHIPITMTLAQRLA